MITKHTPSEQNPHITVGTTPVAIAIDESTGLIYVANYYDGTVSVIDGQNNTKIADIKVGNDPSDIAIDESTNKIYVANYYDGTVSVIDGQSNTKIGNDVKVGSGPRAIAIGTPIYVANFGSDTVSVIDENTNTKIGDDIKVESSPVAIATDKDTNTTYVVSQGNDSVSVIDAEANKVVAKVMFNIEPFNAGHIECNENKLAPIGQEFYMWSGSTCTAKPNQGFEFVSWQENLGGNSTQFIKFSSPPSIWDPILDFLHMKPDKPEATLDITKFGNFTANFKALPPPIPPEYMATLFAVVASALIGSWLTPSFIEWRKTKKQEGKVQTHHLTIKSLYDDGKVDEKDIPRLDKLKDDVMDEYAKGKISEKHYDNLNNTISVLYEEVYKKKIDSLSDKDNNRILLNNVKENIKDAYAKGKISEKHYKLLNEKISDSKNNQQSNNNQLASSSQNLVPTATTQGSPIKS